MNTSKLILSARESLSAYAALIHPDWQPNWHHRVLASVLERVVAGDPDYRRVCIEMPPRAGKALEIHTPIPTPKGWREMGELRAGDEVFAPNGAPTKIVAVSEVWHDRELYAVRDEENHVVLVDEAHEWVAKVADGLQALFKEWRSFTTFNMYWLSHGYGTRWRIRVRKENEAETEVEVEVHETDKRGDTVCIQVEHPSHQFLCGDGYFVTHNSELVSRLFPAWYMAQHPYETLISVTYGSDLTNDMGRKARAYAQSDLFRRIFGMGIDRRTDALTNWELENHSRYFGTTIGSALTGYGANILLVDDPVKNMEEANSEGAKNRIWDWFLSTAYTRLEKNASVAICATRWAQDDLTGRLLALDDSDDSPAWRRISFPMIATQDEYYRKEGEPLWPDKFPLDKCREIEQMVGRRVWGALYQQNPTPDEGVVFTKDSFRYYTKDALDNAYFSAIYQSWDTAVSGVKGSARSACTTWGVLMNSQVPGGVSFWLLDVYAEVLRFPELREKAKQLARAWDVDRIWVEEEQTGRPLIDELKLALGNILTGVRPRARKEARAHAVSALFESGRVFLPDSRSVQAPWLREYEKEMLAFPYGEYADKVDSTTQALSQMMRAEYARGRRVRSPLNPWEAPMASVSSIFGR